MADSGGGTEVYKYGAFLERIVDIHFPTGGFVSSFSCGVDLQFQVYTYGGTDSNGVTHDNLSFLPFHVTISGSHIEPFTLFSGPQEWDSTQSAGANPVFVNASGHVQIKNDALPKGQTGKISFGSTDGGGYQLGPNLGRFSLSVGVGGSQVPEGVYNYTITCVMDEGAWSGGPPVYFFLAQVAQEIDNMTIGNINASCSFQKNFQDKMHSASKEDFGPPYRIIPNQGASLGWKFHGPATIVCNFTMIVGDPCNVSMTDPPGGLNGWIIFDDDDLDPNIPDADGGGGDSGL